MPFGFLQRFRKVSPNRNRAQTTHGAKTTRARLLEVFRGQPVHRANVNARLNQAKMGANRARTAHAAAAHKNAGNDNGNMGLMRYQHRTRSARNALSKAEALHRAVAHQAEAFARTGKLPKGPLTRTKGGRLNLNNHDVSALVEASLHQHAAPRYEAARTSKGHNLRPKYAGVSFDPTHVPHRLELGQRSFAQLREEVFAAHRLANDVGAALRHEQYKPLSQRSQSRIQQLRNNYARIRGIANAAHTQLGAMETKKTWAPGPFRYNTNAQKVAWHPEHKKTMENLFAKSLVLANAQGARRRVTHAQPLQLLNLGYLKPHRVLGRHGEVL